MENKIYFFLERKNNCFTGHVHVWYRLMMQFYSEVYSFMLYYDAWDYEGQKYGVALKEFF